MKFLICADIHLKTQDQFDLKTEPVSKRSIYKLKKLQEIVKQEKPDILIDAGDNFDVRSPSEMLRSAYFMILNSLDVKEIYLVAGNHSTEQGYSAGTSETFVSDKIKMIQPRKIYKVGDIVLIGYTRDDALFHQLTVNNGGKYLITHRDIPSYDLPYEQAFFGHFHEPLQKGNKHSIGALFTDSFGEEGIPCRYLIIDDNGFEFKEIKDIKIKTFNELVEFEDGEYDAVRFKLKGEAKDFIGLNRKELQKRYDKTKIFLEVEVLDEDKKFDSTVSVEELVLAHLKEKNLSDDEQKFGLYYFKEINM